MVHNRFPLFSVRRAGSARWLEAVGLSALLAIAVADDRGLLLRARRYSAVPRWRIEHILNPGQNARQFLSRCFQPLLFLIVRVGRRRGRQPEDLASTGQCGINVRTNVFAAETVNEA